MSKVREITEKIDWYIAIPALYVAVIGILIQYAILFKSKGVAIDFNLNTQLFALFGGLMIVAILANFSNLTWRKRSYWFYGLAVISLLLVLGVGFESNGAQRWLQLGSLQIQPTEIAKLTLVFALARMLDAGTASVNRLRVVIRSLLMVGIPVGLIVLQPDLGSAIVLIIIWFTMLLVSRLNLSKLSFLIVVILTTIIVSIPFLADYQQERIISYFNPSLDTAGANYNATQASIAIGSGGLFGNGLDSGSQSQLNFLPSQHTDFIFAVTAEKLGVLGAGSVIVALSLLLMRMVYLAWATERQFERLLMVGIASFLFFHTFVNIGMNIGIVPVTGLPLPLMSYGGTFALVTVLSIGIAIIISNRIRSRQQHSV